MLFMIEEGIDCKGGKNETGKTISNQAAGGRYLGRRVGSAGRGEPVSYTHLW